LTCCAASLAGALHAIFARAPVQIGAASSGYCSVNLRFAPAVFRSASLSCQSPTCAADRLSSYAFQLNHRLSSVATFSSQPSIDLQLALAIHFPAQPSSRSFDSRLRSTFQLRFPINLRPSPPANLPAMPSDQSPACAFNRIFQLSFPAALQLAPLLDLPALPSNLTSDSHRSLRPFGAALRLTFGFRRRSTFRPYLRTQPRTHRPLYPGAAFKSICDRRRLSTFQPCLGTQLPTRLPLNSLTLPSSQSSTRVFNQPSNCPFRFVSGSRLQFTFRFHRLVDFRLAPLIYLLAAFRFDPWLSPLIFLRAPPSSSTRFCPSTRLYSSDPRSSQ